MLWRHGRTGWNAAGRFQGQLDPPLDAVGRRQARASARVLARLRPDRVVSSDAQRTSATATELAALLAVPVAVDPRLREIRLGRWEGCTHAEVRERFPAEYAAWISGNDLPRGAGESYRAVAERSTAAIAASLADLPAGGLLVVVTHGGTARAAIGALLELPDSAWWRLAPLGNCRWSVLVEAERGWRLAEHNAGDPPRDDASDDR